MKDEELVENFMRFVRVFYKFPPLHNILTAKCEGKMRKFLAYNSSAVIANILSFADKLKIKRIDLIPR